MTYCSGPKTWWEMTGYTACTYIPSFLIKAILLYLIYFLHICELNGGDDTEKKIIFGVIFLLVIIPYEIWNSHSHGENFPLFTTSLKDDKTIGAYIGAYYLKNWSKMILLAGLYCIIIGILFKYSYVSDNELEKNILIGLIILLCCVYIFSVIFDSVKKAKGYFKNISKTEIENMTISFILFLLFKLSIQHGVNINTLLIIIIIVISTFSDNLYTILLNQTV